MGQIEIRLLRMLLFSCALVVFSPAFSLSMPVVSIEPALSSPEAGSLFDVSVAISGVTDLYAYQFDVLFDPLMLSAASVTEGAFLTGAGATSFFEGFVDNSAGSISFVADSLLGSVPGADGSGILAIISFHSLALGSTPLDLASLILLDSNLYDLEASTVNGMVNSIPEPASMLLLGFGLVGLARIRKRFRH